MYSLLLAKPSHDQFWNAIKYVESGGDENAVGDNGDSIGPLQIQKNYYKDAVEKNPALQSGKYKDYVYEDCKGPGSFEYSRAVAESYMSRYATEARLGRPPTYEDMARIHNGGPNGYKEESTVEYWEKVKKILNKKGYYMECTKEYYDRKHANSGYRNQPVFTNNVLRLKPKQLNNYVWYYLIVDINKENYSFQNLHTFNNYFKTCFC